MDELQIIELKNQRVLTTEQLAEVYGTNEDNVKKNFSNHKTNFVRGKHYYFLEGEELKEFKRQVNDIHHPIINKFTSQLYLWTERGANRHCKILDTDKAWEQFDNLEETYFKAKEQSQLLDSYMIEDPLKRAEKWIEEQKEKQFIQKKALFLEQKVEEQSKRLTYLDTILDSTGTMTATQIGADYGMSAKALNKILYEERVQRKVGNQWILYKAHMNKGYTDSSTFEFQRSDGRQDANPTTVWTQGGRMFIHEILTQRGIKANMDVPKSA